MRAAYGRLNIDQVHAILSPPMTDPTPTPRKPILPRSVRRIITEALLVGFFGALVLGIFWELQFPYIGWCVAGVIWLAGAPLLELARIYQSNK